MATPREGLAEVFYGLGEALTSEGGLSVGVIYLRFALFLEPRSPFALAGLTTGWVSETGARTETATPSLARATRIWWKCSCRAWAWCATA